MDIRIVLLPDSEGDKIFKEYSEEIVKNYSSLFELGKGCISHVTLIHAQIEDKNIDKVKEILRSFSDKTSSLNVAFDYKKREVETNNYISIFFENDKEITDLRDTLSEKLKNLILSASKFKLSHVTLTRLINTKDVDKALVQVSTFSNARVHLTKLALCEVGENGTCKNIIFSYDLKDSAGSV